MSESLVIICETGRYDECRAYGLELGYDFGPIEYTVPLSSDASDPATHRGVHVAGTEELVAIMMNPSLGSSPEMQDAIQSCTVSLNGRLRDEPFDPENPSPRLTRSKHFVYVIEKIGLQKIDGQDPGT